MIETKQSITWFANAANRNRRSIGLDTTGWARWSTGSCVRNLYLTIRTNGISTTSHLSSRISHRYLISARRLNLIIINPPKKKGTCKIVDFAVPVDHRIKLKENEKKDNYRHFARELKKKKKTVEHESDIYTNCNWCSWHNHRMINKGTGKLGNKRTSGDHPNYWII